MATTSVDVNINMNGGGGGGVGGGSGVELVSPGGRAGRGVEVVEPGTFEPTNHFYPRVLNAQIHPLVRSFLGLGNARIAKRYCHLHPDASMEAVTNVLQQSTRFFKWGGADLFATTSDKGQKRLVVVETNSCPSGQKSMPLADEDMDAAHRLHGGYRTLLERSFMPALRANANPVDSSPFPAGHLAVLYDKNKMEASGYAATLAELAGEPVLLVPCYTDSGGEMCRFTPDGILQVALRQSGAHRCFLSNSKFRAEVNHNTDNKKTVKPEDDIKSTNNDKDKNMNMDNYVNIMSAEQCGKFFNDRKSAQNPNPSLNPYEPVWVPIRAALRYVTQRPWSRIPPITRTYIYNPVLACLAGGRNKMLAAKAYDMFNAEISDTGLRVHTPDTIWDVAKCEVPLWVQRMGGLAVVKVPYANAGQGVWTITHWDELQSFMNIEHRYDRFIVQALIGNNGWSSLSQNGRLYHVGTIPNLKGNIYAADLRVMIGSSPEGFFPVAIYARRARVPLAESIKDGAQSWDMLGTNLSFKHVDGSWGTESERLLLMDNRDFNRIGIGVDDLIEAYMQTVLAMLAIDGLACKLITPKGNFGMKLFQALNPDPKLLIELYNTQLHPPLQKMVACGYNESSDEGKIKDRQPSISEDVLAKELEKKVTNVVVSNLPDLRVF